MNRPAISIRRATLRRRAEPLFGSTGLARFACIAAFGLASAANAQSLPTGGTVAAGSATIATGANIVTVTQGSQSAAINWQGFSIGADNAVVFVQPNAQAVALNRVTGSDPTVILGNLSANGRVFLINANGILFGQGANVNVGGLVASTLNLSDADFMAGNYRFAGTGGAVTNRGSITANGGFVALLGASVSNQGVIQAKFGTVALAAGEAITLDVAGDGLLNVAIDTGAVNALVANGGLIRADGGVVLMTAQAAGALLHTVVNNDGVIEARTLESHRGTIKLVGDMQTGTTNAAGTLDAGAPDGGNGGFIETSAATVNIANGAMITTAAPAGTTGTWLIDPQDFTIAASGNISGATLSALLVTNSVVISTLTGPDATAPGAPPTSTLHTASPGNGDINVNEAVAWAAAPSTTTLSLNATRDINVNAPITATNGNVVLCCGRDANINAAITTTNGSILASAGRDVKLNSAGANTVNPGLVGVLTVTDGNLMLCADFDVLIAGAVTLTNGSTIPAQSLNLPSGLTIITGNGGTGPGVVGGTLTFAPLTPPVTVTKAAAAINYNPPSYATPGDYSINFTLTAGAALTQRMLVYPTVDRVYDGTTAAVLTGFDSTSASGLPTGIVLVAGPGAAAAFDSAGPGPDVGITYSGYSLAGPNAANYALAVPCCGRPTRTNGIIRAASVVVVPPVVTPPLVTPPVVTPPVIVLPGQTIPLAIPVAAPPETPPVGGPSGGTTPVATPVQLPPVVGAFPIVTALAETAPSAATLTSGAIVEQAILLSPIAPVFTGMTLAVLRGGVTMPVQQLAMVERPAAPLILAAAPVNAPIVPLRVYRPKQDRN